MEDTIPDRYEKNPMLVLVENYILDTLGKLDAGKVAKLNEIVCRTFGGKDWRQVIRQQFHLPPDADEMLKAVWKQRMEEAETTQQELAVEDFAREQADQIFRDLGD
jgi:hypothetical protein